MSKGLEAFLKRIRQDPSNETYVERFLVLLDEEEESTRLPYYRKLFDFLINIKPLLALEVAYQELKLARKMQTARDQIKALGRIERCFLALERPGKAEVVRNEIDSLRGSLLIFPSKKSKQKENKPQKLPEVRGTKVTEPLPPAIDSEATVIEPPPLDVREANFRLPPVLPEEKQAKKTEQTSDELPEVQVFAFQDQEFVKEEKRQAANDVQPSKAFDWGLFFSRISEDVNRWTGSRSGKAAQWVDRLRWQWDISKRREVSKLLAKALHSQERQHEAELLRFILVHAEITEVQSLLKQLAVHASLPSLFLAVMQELLVMKKARQAQFLLYRLAELPLPADMAKAILDSANQIRQALGLYKLAWEENEGLEKLRKQLQRRPEPGLRFIFTSRLG